MTPDKFFSAFLAETGRPAETQYRDCFYFELSERWANALLDLVLEGKKRATSSSIYEYECTGEKMPETDEKMPQAGDLSIVTDWDGEPACIIETTKVTVLPFREMTFELCSLEGEDDCLESWRRGHIKFFTEDGKHTGYTFTEDMPVVFEEFRVVYSVGRTVYREIPYDELDMAIFKDFSRRQDVTRCWRKDDGVWAIKDIAFIDDWSYEEYQAVLEGLRSTAKSGGFVMGAFISGKLKGFVEVEAELFGKNSEYMDMAELIVSEDARHRGIGRRLFNKAKLWANAHGAAKLYISAHSSVETQAFYHSVGAVEAEEYSRRHVEKEPCDCQMECATGAREGNDWGEIIIRRECEGDYRRVEELTRDAFWNHHHPGCDEHYMVHVMRAHADFIKELDLVAEVRGKVVGNIMYTKVKLVAEDGAEREAISFGPISVAPEFQRHGVGKALIEASFARARELGYDAVVIFGHPSNYVSSGFISSKKRNICIGDGIFPTALLVRELVPDCFDGRRYSFEESSVCMLDEEAVEAFDATFPKKEKAYQASQEEFYIYSHSRLVD